MADNDVYITGSEPDWAVQKALDGILAAVEKTQQVSKEQKKVIKDATSGGKVFDGEAVKKFRSGLKKTTVDAFKQGKANKSLFDTTEDLNKEFKESSKSIKGLAIGVGSIASLLGFVYQQFMDTVGVFRELTDQGLSFKLGYMQVTESLARMGMSLDEFQAVMQRNATAMGSMGLDRFTSLISSFGDGFNQFGLTMAEGAEFASEFINQQRLLANYSVYTQKNLNDAVRSNIERLTAFSKILNISRQEIQAAQTEAASDLRVRARFLVEGEAMHKDAQKNFARMIGNLAGINMGGLADVMTEFMGFTDGRWKQSDAFGDIAEVAGAPIAHKIGELVDKISYEGLTEKEQGKYMLELGKLLQDNMGMWKEIEQAGNMTPAIESLYNAALGFTEAEKRKTLNPDGTVSDTVEAAAALNENLKKLTATFGLLGNVVVEKILSLFGQKEGVEATMTSTMDLIATNAGKAADKLMKLATGEESFSKFFSDIGIGIWNAVSEKFKEIWDAGVEKIAEKLEEIKIAIANWSPFGNNQTHLQKKYGENLTEGQVLDRVGIGNSTANVQNRFLLTEAEEELKQAQRKLSIAQMQQRVPVMGAGGGMAQAMAIADEAEAQARIEAILKRIEKLTQKQTETIEDGNG